MAARRKKKPFQLIISLVIALVALFFVWVGVRWWQYYKAKSTHYAAFGSTFPNDYLIHGIDVSKCQDIIAWEEVKAMQVGLSGSGLPLLKPRKDPGNADPLFARNWKRRGPATSSGRLPFLSLRTGWKAAGGEFYPPRQPGFRRPSPVLDIEQLNSVGKTQLRRGQTMAETVGTTTVTPVVYNVDFYKNYLGSDFDQYPLWVAYLYCPASRTH